MPEKKYIPEGYSKLRIVLDDSSHFYVDEIWVTTSNKKYRLLESYDTTIRKLIYSYDSLRNNEYTIVLSSLLNKDFKTFVLFTKDTLLKIGKTQFVNFEPIGDNILGLTDLTQTDTLCIGYESQGCFHHYKSKTIIYRKGEGYVAEFIRDTSQRRNAQQIMHLKGDLVASFSDTLRKFEQCLLSGFKTQAAMQKICNQRLSEAKDGMDSMRANMMMFTSTTSSVIYLRKGNKVFELSNAVINDIPYYDNFLRALNLWPKHGGG